MIMWVAFGAKQIDVVMVEQDMFLKTENLQEKKNSRVISIRPR